MLISKFPLTFILIKIKKIRCRSFRAKFYHLLRNTNKGIEKPKKPQQCAVIRYFQRWKLAPELHLKAINRVRCDQEVLQENYVFSVKIINPPWVHNDL